MAAATLSPRISFSHNLDLDLPPASNSSRRRLDASLILSPSSSDDFDFSTSHEISAAPADDLFAHGMLLPLSSINKPAAAPADDLFAHGMLLPLSSINKPAAALDHHRQNTENEPKKAQPESPKHLNCTGAPPNTKPRPPPSSPSFWANIRRSSSVGTGSKSRLGSICPFPRSKSTGSHQTPDQNQSQKMRNSSKNSQSQSQSQSQKMRNLSKNSQSQNQNQNWYNYYYSRNSKSSSHGNGVRINPVINVPAHFIPRGGNTGASSSGGSGNGRGGGHSLFTYLLCNCRDKCCKELENCSP